MGKDSRFIRAFSTWSWACRPRDRCPRWVIYIPGYLLAGEVLSLLEDLPRRPPVVPDGNNHLAHPSARNHQIPSCCSPFRRHFSARFRWPTSNFISSFFTLTQSIHFPLSFLIFFFFFFFFFRSSDRISDKSFTCYSIVLKNYQRIIEIENSNFLPFRDESIRKVKSNERSIDE